VELKLLIKRGAVLAAANWQTVVIQFVSKTTFQALLAVPVVGAALLVAILAGTDVANLLQGSLQDIVVNVARALTAEPAALTAFLIAFAIVLFGGSTLMFLVKGGTIDVLLAASQSAASLHPEPLTWDSVRPVMRFTVDRFIGGCRRLFRPYFKLGLLLMLIYGVSAAAYLGFVVVGYRAADERAFILGWTVVTTLATAVLVLWITFVNVLYLLMQAAIAAEDVGVFDALRIVARLIRVGFRELSGVFLVMLAVQIGATFASALAWSGVGLIAFIPLIGLAVIPLQLAALVLRRLAFEYLGLTAAGAYMTSYDGHRESLRSLTFVRASSASHPAS
jgi:hypothetical protein